MTTPESKPVELMRRLRREIAEDYKGLSREERLRRMRAEIAEHPILRGWVERSKEKAASK